MQNGINNKYKKEHIIEKVANRWGYAIFNGEVVFVKNCIQNKKYNKIYQIIESKNKDLTDGMYVITSYDVTLHIDNSKRHNDIIKIVSKKFDKLAGCDKYSPKNFKSADEYYKWLEKKKFISKKEVDALSMDNLKDMPQFQICNG